MLIFFLRTETSTLKMYTIAQCTGACLFLQVLDLTIWHCSTSSRQDSKGSSSYCFSLPLKTHQPKMASSLAAAGAAILTQTGDKKLFSSK